MFRFSQRSLNRMEGVDGRLQQIAHRALAISKVDFGIPEYGGVRSQQDQHYLYSTGASSVDGITNISRHQDGKALDVFAYVNGKASWEPEHMAMVAVAMMQAASELGHKLEWGGLWNNSDMPHFQLTD